MRDKLKAAIREVPISQTYEEYVEALADRLNEVVEEIFEEIESIVDKRTSFDGYIYSLLVKREFAKLKKKYTEDKDV